MKECGIEWVSHFTNDTEGLAARLNSTGGDRINFPRESTLTSVALGQAESELTKGREDANSVVIVITDGRPMSEQNTKAAAKRVQEKAKIVWVPVSSSAPLDLIAEMAGLPKDENVVKVSTFKTLHTPN